MQKRITTILGAGSILDFDFKDNSIIPSTNEITKALLDIKVKGLDVDEISLIRDVYSKLVEEAKKAYLGFHPGVTYYEPEINFEELLDVIETLASSNTSWLKEGYPFPMASSLVSPKLRYESIEYKRALEAIIDGILNIVNDYNDHFAGQVNKELWYRDFWKGFAGKNDIFNFNYDTTIEDSLGNEYNDGFIPSEQKFDRFSPKHLMTNPQQVTTVNHLHGCVLYSDANPAIGQHEYSNRDLFKFKSHKDVSVSKQCMTTSQSKEYMFYAPIITGLKKTDKICYLPHSYYHCNLAMKILENPSLLIIGYSFGDIYVNQLLGRHKLIHGDSQRVIIIDKYPEYTNSEWTSLYQYFINKPFGGLREFVLRQLEEADPFNAFRNNIEYVDKNVWQAKHGRLRLYTGGFKNTVVNYTEEIMNFLQ